MVEETGKLRWTGTECKVSKYLWHIGNRRIFLYLKCNIFTKLSDNYNCLPCLNHSFNSSIVFSTDHFKCNKRYKINIYYLQHNIIKTHLVDDCSQSDLSSLIANLPTQSRYIYPYKLPSYSSLYYDMKLTCHFNQSIEIIYRCDLSNKQWIYVYGNSNHFQACYLPCDLSERLELLNKYFTKDEQSKIRTKYIAKSKSVRFRCFHTTENRWKSINYKCGTKSLTKYQWFRLHSCFQPIITTTTTEFPRKFNWDF